ncbi:MAG: HAMP domain-containing histidine kinase [Thermoplasmatales archaeon]|nr:MAG: HAMP domain-containing histidine kinase [Thermoplasmatales archaeon]
MKGKINISLSLKLTLIVIIVSALTIFSIGFVNLYFFNINYEDLFFENPYYETASSHIQALNAIIGNSSVLNDKNQLENKTNEFLYSIPPDYSDNILEITVNLPNETGELFVFFSTNNETIGEISNPYIQGTEKDSIACNINAFKEDHIYIISEHNENSHELIMLYPINFTGNIEGTYELVLSMNDAYLRFEEELESQVKWTVIISTVSLFLLIFTILYLLSRIIVKPIITFRDSAKVIGQGNLDTKVEIKSKDELGELASAFNKMANDLKESRDKIFEYNKILENLLKQKDEFIGQLGHDLKNPLQPLIGLLPMLIEQEKDPKIKEGLQLMNKNAEYMKDLIFKTLQLAKLRSSDIKFDFENLNLAELSNDVVESQKLLFKENKIDVENNISKNIFLKADKLRIEELFHNLITNAVKYMGQVDGKIILDAKQDKDVVTVSITDNGKGMAKDQLKRVFDEFYRADKFVRLKDSVGLGLSICKRIVEKHGGKIWADSPGVGKGSTFYFTLKSGSEK